MVLTDCTSGNEQFIKYRAMTYDAEKSIIPSKHVYRMVSTNHGSNQSMNEQWETIVHMNVIAPLN